MHTTRGFLLGLGIGLVFALGFVTATLVVPRATAQSSDHWQYMTMDHGFDEGRWANEQGRLGWRFWGYDGGDSHKLIFERRTP